MGKGKGNADRNENNKIDAEATVLFDKLFLHDWQKFKVEPDIHVDYQLEPRIGATYQIESRHEDAVTGRRIFVQQKGIRKMSISGGTGKLKRISVDHIKYWADVCPLPVFLFVADLHTQNGYWLFVQQYVDRKMESGWRDQDTITIDVPLDQFFGGSVSLDAAISEAQEYVIVRRPGIVQTALKGRQKILQALDSRFEVSVTANDKGREQIALRPKELVEVMFTFRAGLERVEQVRSDMIDKGLPVLLEPTELEVSGSELIREVFKNPVIYHQMITIPLVLSCDILNPDGSLLKTIEFPPTVMEGGEKELRINVALPSGAVGIRGIVTAEKFSLTFRLSNQEWMGKRILQLTNFDDYQLVLRCLAGELTSVLRGYVNGKRIIDAKNSGHEIKQDEHVKMVMLLEEARWIARKLDIDPVLPNQITTDEIRDIFTIREMLQYGTRKPYPTSSISQEHVVPKTHDYMKVKKSKMSTLAFRRPTEHTTLFGEPIVVPAVEFTMTKTRIGSISGPFPVPNRPDYQRYDSVLRPTAKSKMTVQSLPPEFEQTMQESDGDLKKVDSVSESDGSPSTG